MIPPSALPIVNIGGRWYPTITIGNQVWTAENLDFDLNGEIPVGTSYSNSEPRAAYYNDDQATWGWDGRKCGLLYNWNAVNKLNTEYTFPDGFHIPSNSEFNELLTLIGSGNQSKMMTTVSWKSGWTGTNDYGWNGMPSEAFNNYGFQNQTRANYWTSSNAWDTNYIYIYLQPDAFASSYISMTDGYSLRLVKSLT